MVVEIAVPDDWTPGQVLAMRQLLQHAVRTAVPVIALVRKDVTADQRVATAEARLAEEIL